MSMRALLMSLVAVAACGDPAPVEPSPPPPAEPAVEQALAAGVDRGAEVFATHCTSCHGVEGRGDGPAGVGLEPPVADLVGPRAAHLRGIPRRTIIEEGRPGTAMVAWKAVLSPADLDAVYGHVHNMKHGSGGGHGAQVDPAALDKARGAMGALATSLKSKLKATMAESGPMAALEVCAVDAQAVTKQVADEQGVTVGRSSLRLRNPANAPPDWVATWLNEQGERPAVGVEGLAQAATLDDGTRVVRVLKPLQVEAPCLICHGPEEGRLPELSAVLAERYPDDQATGYAAGDLRGAIWAETPVH